MNRPRALLMYSRPHFDPSRNWVSASSAGVIASGLFRALGEVGYDVTYIDPSEIASVAGQHFEVFLGQNLYWTRAMRACRADFKILFMPVVNPIRRMQEMKDASRRSGFPPEIFPRSDLDAYHECDAVFQIGNDEAVQELLSEGVRPEKILHCHYGIPPAPDFQVSPSERSRNFLFLASGINLAKGFPFLQELWNRVRRSDSRLSIVGKVYDERFEAPLRNFVSDPKQRAEYLGFIPSENPLYWESLARCGWLLFPTIGEAEPGTVLEALASGIVPILDNHNSGVDFHLGLLSGSLVSNNVEFFLKNQMEDQGHLWKILSEKARRHWQFFYSADRWISRLKFALGHLNQHGELPRPQVSGMDASQRLSSLVVLGPRPLRVSPTAGRDNHYLLVKDSRLSVHPSDIARALDRMQEYPAISSIQWEKGSTTYPYLSELPAADAEPLGGVTLIRSDHLESPWEAGQRPKFRSDALRLMWGSSSYGTLISDRVLLSAGKNFDRGWCNRYSPVRIWRRIEYRNCSFIKDF